VFSYAVIMVNLYGFKREFCLECRFLAPVLSTSKVTLCHMQSSIVIKVGDLGNSHKQLQPC
jgi:hypothetical protein